MEISVLSKLPAQMTDQLDVVLARMKRHATMLLMTLNYDPRLHQHLSHLGLSDSVSLNMYDWIQQAQSVHSIGFDYDYRIRQFYDKRHLQLLPQNGQYNMLLSGQVVGQFISRHHRLSAINLYDQDEVRWARDIYDCRGFLSKRLWFSKEQTVSRETYYQPDGRVALEIYRQNASLKICLSMRHLHEQQWFSSIDDLRVWWLHQVLAKIEAIYIDDRQVDHLFLPIASSASTIFVVHYDGLTRARLDWLSEHAHHVVAVNAKIARKYGFEFQKQTVDTMPYSLQIQEFNQVATIIDCRTKTDVKKLWLSISQLLQASSQLTINIFGRVDKLIISDFDQQLRDFLTAGRVKTWFNLSVNERSVKLSQMSLAWWYPTYAASGFYPSLINACGVPLITTSSGYRGARVRSRQPEQLVRAVMLGYSHLADWREDVKKSNTPAFSAS